MRYHECDAQRVVFNGHYGTYVDMAVTEFFNQLLPNRHDSDRPGSEAVEFQLVRQVIEWKAPARFNDLIEISAWCEKVGTTSFVMRFELRKARPRQALETQPFVTADTISVVMNGNTWTKLSISPDLRANLLRGAPGVTVDHAGHAQIDRA